MKEKQGQEASDRQPFGWISNQVGTCGRKKQLAAFITDQCNLHFRGAKVPLGELDAGYYHLVVVSLSL